VPEHGPYEDTFLTKDYLNSRSREVLAARSLGPAVEQLRKESDTHTIELQLAYRMELEDALRTIGANAQINEFTCGRNICIGSVRSADMTWKDDWLRELRQDQRLPMPSLSLMQGRLESGLHELRFIFTTKPGPGGFVIDKG